jgi:hypothetical protein
MPKKISDAQYREAAHRLHHADGEVEIDENAKLSRGDDPGCYVEAWVWVPNEDVKSKLAPDEQARWQTPQVTRRYIAQVLPIGTGRTITIDVIGDGNTSEDESMKIAEEFARKKLKAKSMRVSQWTKPVEGSYREKADYVTGPGR